MSNPQDPIIARLEAVERVAYGHQTGVTRYEMQDAIAAVKANDGAALKLLQAEVKELRAQLAMLLPKNEFIASRNKLADDVQATLVEVVSDAMLETEKIARRDLVDATTAIRSDVARAEAAAAANIKHAADVLMAYASELGA